MKSLAIGEADVPIAKVEHLSMCSDKDLLRMSEVDASQESVLMCSTEENFCVRSSLLCTTSRGVVGSFSGGLLGRSRIWSTGVAMSGLGGLVPVGMAEVDFDLKSCVTMPEICEGRGAKRRVGWISLL